MPREASVRWHPKDAPEGVGSWRSDVGPIGKSGRRTPVYFRFPHNKAGEKQARKALKEYVARREEAEEQERLHASNPTAGEVVRRFLLHFVGLVAENERANTTAKCHGERLNRFLNFVGPDGKAMRDRMARSLTDDDGARYIEYLKHKECKRIKGKRVKGWSARSIDGELRSLNTCFNWAASPVPGRDPKQFIPSNPFASLKPGRVVKVRRKLIERAEVAKFLRFAWRDVNHFWLRPCGRCYGCAMARREPSRPCQRPHGKVPDYFRSTVLMCRMQYWCGSRPSELCKATWGPTGICPDAGWDARGHRDEFGRWWGAITLHGKTTRETTRIRIIPVPPLLTRAIERWRQSPSCHPVFIFPRNTREEPNQWDSNALGRRLRGWRDAIGLGEHFVLYGMRATFYTRSVHDAGMTGEAVGLVGGTSGNIVRGSYLQEEKAMAIRNAMQIDRSQRSKSRADD